MKVDPEQQASSTLFRRPENVFSMLWVSVKQGGLTFYVVHNGIRELQVPDDDDLRPTMKLEGLRIQGEDTEGNLLETTWDELDEALYRLDSMGVDDSTTSIPMCSLDNLATYYGGWQKANEI